MTPTHTEESSPELRPCPFPHEIKRGVFLEVDTVDFGFVRGACSDCGCAGPFVTLDSCERVTAAERAEASSLWNSRASISSTRATTDEVERVDEAARMLLPFLTDDMTFASARELVSELANALSPAKGDQK